MFPVKPPTQAAIDAANNSPEWQAMKAAADTKMGALESDVALKVSKAIAQFITKEPFFAAIALRQEITQSYEIPTAATDGKRIIYNPRFFAEMPQKHVATVLAHEVMHIANLHHVRMVGRNHESWNIAGDYVINLTLRDAGFEIPAGGLIDTKYAGMTTEQVYAIVEAQKEKDRDKQKGNNSDGAGAGVGAPSNQDSDGDNDDPNSSDPGGMGGVMLPQDSNGGNKPNQSEISQAELDTTVMVMQAAQSAKGIGTLPAHIAELIEKLRNPAEDWKAILREFAEVITQADYSWSRPNIRFGGGSCMPPSLHSKKVGGIGIIMDTSGSIDTVLATQFLSEGQNILDELMPEYVRIIQIDTQVNSDNTYTQGDTIKEKLQGRGGTCFQPAFDYIAQNFDSEPLCVLYFTDMQCSDKPTDPGYPVLWITYGDFKYGLKPTFGRIVEATQV